MTELSNNLTLVKILAILIPLITATLLYKCMPNIAGRTRRYKIAVLFISSSLSLDLISAVLFFVGWFNSITLLVLRLYVITGALPFYYLASTYWQDAMLEKNNYLKFIGIQIPGLIIGLEIGLYLTMINAFRQSAIAFGIFTSLPGLALLGPSYLQ